MRRIGPVLLVVALVGCSSRRGPATESSALPPTVAEADEPSAASEDSESEEEPLALKEEEAIEAAEENVDDASDAGELELESSLDSDDSDSRRDDEESTAAAEPQDRGGAEPLPAPPSAPQASPSAPPPPASTPSRARETAAPGARAPSSKRASGGSRAPVAPTSRWPDRVVTVWFGTDRVRDAAFSGGFGAAPGGALVVGTLDVSIPESHTTGVLERPSLFRLELSEDPERHVVLGDVRSMSEADFRDSLAASGNETALVFVHGFWNSFEDGALRAAQLSWDLGYPGVPAMYAWGSAGSAVGYLTDASSVVQAEPHFDAFLDLLVDGTGVREVHVVAHSMGTRLATETLARRGREGRPGVSELVLAAPDIDVKHFEAELSGPLAQATERLTVYGSSTDQALAMSAQLNAMVRLGDASSGALSLAGLEGIDATPIETSMDGHSYIAHNPSVLADLSCLLAHVPVVDRPWLAAVEGSWTFAKAPEGAGCELSP